VPLQIKYQFFLLLALHGFDGVLAFHGAAPIRLRLKVNERHGPPRARVACPAPGVMGFDTALRIGRPAGIKGPIRALKNIAKAICQLIFLLVAIYDATAKECLYDLLAEIRNFQSLTTLL
jgi:hypothetical protein